MIHTQYVVHTHYVIHTAQRYPRRGRWIHLRDLGCRITSISRLGHVPRLNRPFSVRSPPIKLVSYLRWVARSKLFSFFLRASSQSSLASAIDIRYRSATHPVTAMALSSSVPSDSPGPPCDTSGTGQAIPPPLSPSVYYYGLRILFPSPQVSAPSLADRESVFSQNAALYHQLEIQVTAVTDCRALEEAYRGQKLQIDRLQAEMQSYIKLVPRLATYVQQRFTRLWCDAD